MSDARPDPAFASLGDELEFACREAVAWKQRLFLALVEVMTIGERYSSHDRTEPE